MIVFCHLYNDRSGSPMVLRATIAALDAQRDGMLFVGSDGRGVLEDTALPTRRYWYRRSRFRLITLLTYLTSQIALYRALSRTHTIPADAVVFVNTLLPIGAMLWGKRTKRRVIVHVHEVSITPAPLRHLLIAFARHCADQLLYVSRDHLARLPIAGPPAQAIANPVSTQLRNRADLGLAYAPRRSGRFEVLMLASLRTYKGVTDFMDLAHALRDRSDIHFTLVLNADPAEVAAFAARYPRACNVSLQPRTDRPAEFYATADVVLNLSRPDQWIETFGLTLAEAMTFGIPVIAPPVGGPAEIITHGQEGFCIDTRDTAALTKTICTLADYPEQTMAMSRAARLRADDFTFDTYAAQIRSLLDDAPAPMMKVAKAA